MNSRAEDRACLVRTVLAKYGATLAPAGSPRALLASRAAACPAIGARLDAEWLTLVAPLPDGMRDRSPWRLLARNPGLPAAVRITLAIGERVPCFRADIPVLTDEPECDAMLTQRTLEACDALAVAMGSCAGESQKSYPVSRSARSETPGDDALASLASLCTTSGWPFTVPRAGDITIGLEVPHRFVQATLSPDPAGGVRLKADLLRQLSPSGRSGDAVAVFLLSASDVTRLVRPSAVPNEDGVDIRLDVSWPGLSCAAELAIGLEALSVASRVVAGEVEALCENSFASEYLRTCEREHEEVQAA